MAINFHDKKIETIRKVLKNQSPIVGISGQEKRNRSTVAAQFRMPGFPYVLVTTDIFREGEDLHTYCQNIYHYGIPWNPSDMEQRTGRIDRINSMSYRKIQEHRQINRDSRIHVFYPYLSQSIEVNQVAKVFKNLNDFIRTFNMIEAERTTETTISVDERIYSDDICPPIEGKLTSIYV